MKKLIASLTAASILIAGVVTVSAQDDTPPPPTSAEEFRGFGFRDGGPRGPRNFQRGQMLMNSELMALVEEYTGLQGRDLAQAVRGGSTLAELIEANGASVDEFVSEATAQLESRIDTAVENGRLTAEQADALKAELPALVTAIVNGERPVGGWRGTGSGGMFGPRGGAALEMLPLELVEEYTGLTPTEVREALQDGATMAELIEANEQSVDAFVDAIMAELEPRIDGRAEQMKQILRERITARINGEIPPRVMPPFADGE